MNFGISHVSLGDVSRRYLFMNVCVCIKEGYGSGKIRKALNIY